MINENSAPPLSEINPEIQAPLTPEATPTVETESQPVGLQQRLESEQHRYLQHRGLKELSHSLSHPVHDIIEQLKQPQLLGGELILGRTTMWQEEHRQRFALLLEGLGVNATGLTGNQDLPTRYPDVTLRLSYSRTDASGQLEQTDVSLVVDKDPLTNQSQPSPSLEALKATLESHRSYQWTEEVRQLVSEMMATPDRTQNFPPFGSTHLTRDLLPQIDQFLKSNLPSGKTDIPNVLGQINQPHPELFQSAEPIKIFTIPTPQPGVSLDLLIQANPESPSTLSMSWQIQIDNETTERHLLEKPFLHSQPALEFVQICEQAGLTPKDRIRSSLTESHQEYGFNPRYGNGYADLSRKFLVAAGESPEDFCQRLFDSPLEAVRQAVQKALTQPLSEPGRILFSLLADGLGIARSQPALPRFDRWTDSGRSIKDGSCKDAETYYVNTTFHGSGTLKQESHWIRKSHNGVETCLLTEPVQVDGLTLPPGFLCRVNSEGTKIEPLRPTMFCFSREDAQDAFGDQFRASKQDSTRYNNDTYLDQMWDQTGQQSVLLKKSQSASFAA